MTVTPRPILILGSTGCVGRALAAVWPHDVPVLWQHRHAAQALPHSITWDILNAPAPDLPALAGLVVLAGVTGADPLGHNANLARVACDLGQTQGCRVLIASSQAVYGASTLLGQADLTEDQARVHPGSYGAAKLAMEAAVADHPYDQTCCLRIANVIGCDMLLKTAATGSVRLDRFADGQSPQRHYIGPVTLADILLQLLARTAPLPPVMNVAQPGVTRMQDLMVAADVPFVWQDASAQAMQRMALDLTRLMARVTLPTATPASLIAQARAAGWRPAA